METEKYVHQYRSEYTCDMCQTPITRETRTRGTPLEPRALLSFCGEECAKRADELLVAEKA